MSKTEVENYIQSLNREGLEQLLLDLYSTREEAKDFLDYVTFPNDKVKEMITLGAQANKISNIANGMGRKYSRTIQDQDLAKLMFVTDKEGNLVLKKPFRSRESMDIHDMNNGICPFIIQKYRTLRLVSSKTGDEVIVEIKDAKVTKDSTEDNWKITYFLGDRL